MRLFMQMKTDGFKMNKKGGMLDDALDYIFLVLGGIIVLLFVGWAFSVNSDNTQERMVNYYNEPQAVQEELVKLQFTYLLNGQINPADVEQKIEQVHQKYLPKDKLVPVVNTYE